MDELVRKIQDSMVESTFSESEHAHLCALIRLTVEFYDFLQVGNLQVREYAKRTKQHLWLKDPNQLKEFEQEYSIETIFSGIDGFCSVSAAYSVLQGASRSAIQWDKVTALTIGDQFIEMFDEFILEAPFERRCRLLLDLFKLQIVYAGISYD